MKVELNSRQELLLADLKALFESGRAELTLHVKEGCLHVGLRLDGQRVADASEYCHQVSP